MKRSIIKTILSTALIIAVIASVGALAGCGSSQITVPDVTGMTQEEAEQAITDAGLTMEVQREKYSNKTPKGSIDSMITKTDKAVEKGSTVQVVLSLGEGVTVPDIGVLTAKEAENYLTVLGLKPVLVEEYSDEVEEGNIISYTDGGQTLPVGTEVTITVSKGPES